MKYLFAILFGVTIFLPLVVTSLSPSSVTRFASVGDFGNGSNEAARVAALIEAWEPSFLVTTGDNNYLGENIERAFAPYNEFLPDRVFRSLGNHDWDTIKVDLVFFEMPGNERYYDVVRGDVHLFIVDSDNREPDGAAETSVQGNWLRRGLEQSQTPWQIVVFHHSPYSSGDHGGNVKLQWDFDRWGADLVLTGHDHDYERLEIEGIPYIVNGAGGADLQPFRKTVPGSIIRYNAKHGALLLEATPSTLTTRFYTLDGELIDEVVNQN